MIRIGPSQGCTVAREIFLAFLVVILVYTGMAVSTLLNADSEKADQIQGL